jgi:hypothetical protein
MNTITKFLISFALVGYFEPAIKHREPALAGYVAVSSTSKCSSTTPKPSAAERLKSRGCGQVTVHQETRDPQLACISLFGVPFGTQTHPSKRTTVTTTAATHIAATKQNAEVSETRRLRKSSGVKKIPVVSEITGATARTMSENAEGKKLTMTNPATKGIAMRTAAWLCRRVQVRKMAFAFS